jgi:hypothetical protein
LELTENKYNVARESQKARSAPVDEATQALAEELFNLQVQVQTEVQAEQEKALAAGCGEAPVTQNMQPVALFTGLAAPVPPFAGPVAPLASLGGAVAVPQVVPQHFPTQMDPGAFQQMARQNQERIRQQILQTQQQIRQRSQVIIQQHQQHQQQQRQVMVPRR